MTNKYLIGAYPSGYALSATYTGLKIKSTASVGGAGVSATFLATIINYGSAHGSGYGVSLTAGGTVRNGSSLYLGATISSGDYGVHITGASGALDNYGTITGSNVGAALTQGGTVVNGSVSDTNASIAGPRYAVQIANGGGSVTNFGALRSTAFSAVELNGGSITNGATNDTTASIVGGLSGVFSNALAAVANFGVIEGTTQFGLFLAAGGTVTNGANTDTKAVIQGDSGIAVTNLTATVTNFGTIAGAGTISSAAGVSLYGGGAITNGSPTDHFAQITGYLGVYAVKAAVSVANYGTITGAGVYKSGVYLTAGGSVTNGTHGDRVALTTGGQGVTLILNGNVNNYGTIQGVKTDAVYLKAGGTVFNGSAASPDATIDGNTAGVDARASATVNNFGTVHGGPSSFGILFTVAGRLINGSVGDTAALVSGGAGVAVQGSAFVFNQGTIHGSQGDGAALSGGGSLINGGPTDTRALIEGYNGVQITATAAVVTNFGTLHGLSGEPNYAGVYLTAGGVVTNGAVNDTAALIDGYNGVLATTAAATVANFSTIDGVGLSGEAGVYLKAGGIVTNGASQRQQGRDRGLRRPWSILGVGTVTNFGTIEGFGGVAVQLNSASSVLVVEAGSVFQGSNLRRRRHAGAGRRDRDAGRPVRRFGRDGLRQHGSDHLPGVQ